MWLTTPEEDNATDYYRKVLRLDPENTEALEGLRRVVEQYLGWAEQTLVKSQRARAEEYLSKAASVIPDHPGIRQLQSKLTLAEQEMVHGWLGVQVRDLTAELAQSFGLSRPYGVLIAKVRLKRRDCKQGMLFWHSKGSK